MTATLSKLETVKRNRFVGELSRQLDTNPKFRELSDGMRKLVRSAIKDSPIDGSLKDCATDADLAKRAVARIDRAIGVAKDFIERKKAVDPNYDVDQDTHALGERQETEHAARDNEPTGLRRLKKAFGKRETSIEDQIKNGLLGAGMRVNRSATNPVILDKLKTNGVEPGFIYRNDWSTDDTRGFMADVNSAESRAALGALKEKDPAFAAACEGKTVREQILLAGRAHPAAMAAASELLIEEAAKLVRGEGRAPAPDAVKALATALKNYFTNPKDIEQLSQISGGTCDKALLDETKKNLFVDIRDAVMSMGPKNADGTDNVLYARSPVFKHFTDRAIVKLDYNEGSKFSSGDSAHAGTFMRPERVVLGRKMGQIYRFTSRQSADTISAGAVTEALANDLTRDRARAVFRRTPQDHARREVQGRLQGPGGGDAQGRPRGEAQGRAQGPPDGESRQVQGLLPPHRRPRRHRQARAEQGLRRRQVLRHRPRPLARGERQVPPGNAASSRRPSTTTAPRSIRRRRASPTPRRRCAGRSAPTSTRRRRSSTSR